MQRLLDQHRRNQQALELSQTLPPLADRQSTNLQNGITLGQWAGGKKPESFEAAMQANLEGQKSEQAAIAAELRLAAEKLASFAKDAPDADAVARFQKAVEAAEKVQPGVDAAAGALAEAQLLKAVAEEKAARDALRRLAREVAPPQDKAAALREAERELGKLAEEQREIAANARHATEAKQLPALEAPQGDVAFRSDLLAQDLKKDAAAAAQALKAAHEKMQDARVGMAEQNASAALKGAQEALDQLEAAHARLAQEAARAEALAGKSGDPVKDLQTLQHQTERLAQQQAAAARNPDKSAQPALAQQAAQLAQRAEAIAPQAAPSMQQAAADARQAAQAAQPAQAAAAQQAAAQNLQQAAQQLAQQAAAAQQAQQQLAAAEQAAAALAEIIIAEQQLELETAKTLAQAKPNAPADYKTYGAKQTQIRAQTDAFKTNLAPSLDAATAPLNEANAAMGEARTRLESAEGETAKTAELRAIAALFSAQQALGQSIAQAREAIQQEPAPMDASANQMAQAQLGQAAQQLAQAQQNIESAQAAQAAQQQAQQAGQPTAARAAAQQAAGAMEQASQQAAQAASQAGATAAKGAASNAPAQAAAQQAKAARKPRRPQAIGLPPHKPPVGQAQAALAQAQAALAQAQAGVTASAERAMPGSGQQPGPPGSKPGNQPGTPGGTTAAQKYTPGAPETLQMATRAERLKKANFTGLPPRERAAIEQSQGEKYPEEYGPQVEQYLLNLARESAGR